MRPFRASRFVALTAASLLAGLVTCGTAAAAPGHQVGVPFDLRGFIAARVAA